MLVHVVTVDDPTNTPCMQPLHEPSGVGDVLGSGDDLFMPAGGDELGVGLANKSRDATSPWRYRIVLDENEAREFRWHRWPTHRRGEEPLHALLAPRPSAVDEVIIGRAVENDSALITGDADRLLGVGRDPGLAPRVGVPQVRQPCHYQTRMEVQLRLVDQNQVRGVGEALKVQGGDKNIHLARAERA